MTYSDDIHTTQRFANAAEVFVAALERLYPADHFDAFYHPGTLRRAYWVALQRALDRFTVQDRGPVYALLDGEFFSDIRMVDELLKLFLPGQMPDYRAVAALWRAILGMDSANLPALVMESEKLFALLEEEMRESPDLRLPLQQLAHVGTMQRPAWRDDPTTAEKDLNRLLDTALIAGPGRLSLQVRHLMALTSDRAPQPADDPGHALHMLAQLAEYLQADGLRLLWNNLDTLEDREQQLHVLSLIAPHLNRLGIGDDPLSLVLDAIDANPALNVPALRVEVLLRLAPHLATPNDGTMPNLQQRVLAEVQAVGDPASRVRALGALIPYLPAHLQMQAISQALEAANSGIASESARAEALSDLAPHLPPESQERLMSIAHDLDSADARATLLGRMIPHVDAPLKTRALIGALNAIEKISGDEARTRALIALAPHIDSIGPLQYMPEGLRQAIEVTFSIEHQGDRARAFAALAPYLSPELLREALHATRDIMDDYDRAVTMNRLAPHLPEDLQVVAFGIARELRPAQARATALVAIAPYLTLTARQEALTEALAAAVAVEDRYDRVVALADLAPHLLEDLQARALTDALRAMRSIPDENERRRALVFLAPHLLDDQLPDALADAYTIQDHTERTPAVSALMPRLPDEPRLRVGQETIEWARKATAPHHKANILAAIAPVLPDELIFEAIQAAEQIETAYDRLHVLSVLLPRHPDYLHGVALKTAHEVPNRYQRVNALLELIPHTPVVLRYPILDEALDTALGMQDDYDRASALANLAPYVDTQADVQNQQQDALGLAIQACYEVEDAGARASLLAQVADVWADLLAPAQSYTLWREVVAYLRERPQLEVMGDLAALAPVLAQIGGPQAVEAVAEKLIVALFHTQR